MYIATYTHSTLCANTYLHSIVVFISKQKEKKMTKKKHKYKDGFVLSCF